MMVFMWYKQESIANAAETSIKGLFFKRCFVTLKLFNGIK